MFLQDSPHDINDFLHAVNFVTPNNMDIKYFIVPIAADTSALQVAANNSGFTREVENPVQENNIPGITDTVIYAKKDFKSRQSFNNSNFDVSHIPNEFPITNNGALKASEQAKLLDDGGEIKNPNRGIKVIESTRRTLDIMLKKAVGPLPKNTICHFVKKGSI